MNNILKLINGDIFIENSYTLMKMFLEIIFSWRLLIVILLFFSIKHLWRFLKSHLALLLKRRIKFYKKLQIILEPIEEDIKNIFYGLIGMFFSLSIVNLLFTVLPLWIYQTSWLTNYDDNFILPQQIEFAKFIYQFMGHGHILFLELMLISWSFWMLMLAFLGWVFKTAAKITWSIAIILYALAIFVSSYVSIILEITK